MREIENLVVHCTGGSPRQTVDSIRNYWKQVMKWNNPGYHVLIDVSGKRHVLASDDKITNGVAGHNRKSLHVCYIGGKTNAGFADTRTQAQKVELRNVLKEWKAKYPKAKIKGHRDFSPDLNKNGKIEHFEYIKFCPGFNAIEEYKDL